MREGLARLMGGALGPEDQSVSVCVYVREIMRERESPTPLSSSTPDASSIDVQ